MERLQTTARRWIAIPLLGLIVTAGCVDPAQERISLLMDEKEQILRERDLAQAELVAAQEEAGRLQRERASLQERLDAVQGKLEAMPNPPENWRSVPGGAMTSIPGTVLFDSGKAVLRAGAHATLEHLAATILESFPGKDIYIFGHTDAQPIVRSGFRDNWQLSAERALAVVDSLSRNGVAPERIVAAAVGEHRPLIEGAVAEQRNRRVEIYAVSGIGPAAAGDNP